MEDGSALQHLANRFNISTRVIQKASNCKPDNQSEKEILWTYHIPFLQAASGGRAFWIEHQRPP